MAELQTPHASSQAKIFSSYNWWDKHNLLNRITDERCNYIQMCVDTVFGKHAHRQQEALEIGCGGGLICEGLAQRGMVVEGIDPSLEALEVARSHTRQSGVGHVTSFACGYAEALPYADGSFSVIVCLDVLEHVQDLQATVREIARVLAPGGLLVFDTINRTWLARLALIWIGERFFHTQGLVPGLHSYRDFIKPRELREVLTQNNLAIQEIRGFMPHFSKGQLVLKPGWFTGVSYVGYATKDRA